MSRSKLHPGVKVAIIRGEHKGMDAEIVHLFPWRKADHRPDGPPNPSKQLPVILEGGKTAFINKDNLALKEVVDEEDTD